jgi:hypothetical protein
MRLNMPMHHQAMFTGVVLGVVSMLRRQNRQQTDGGGERHRRERVEVHHNQ